ncbi:hypothetical protein ES702_01259 [subsurface metagenome]
MKTKFEKFKALIKMFRLLDNWDDYLKDYWRSAPQSNFRLRDGKIINGIERVIFNEIFIYEDYFPNENFKIKKGDIVMDIGANVGTFSIYCKDAKKIYAFEPVLENIKLLKGNLLKNSITNVEVIDKAVTSKKGFQKIYISGKNNAAHTLINSDVVETIRTEIINTIPLEDFIKENKIKEINFLKLDCEGSEFEILYSLSEESFKKIDKISMEVHNFTGKEDFNKLVDFLRKKGFEVERSEIYNEILMMVYAIKPHLKIV